MAVDRWQMTGDRWQLVDGRQQMVVERSLSRCLIYLLSVNYQLPSITCQLLMQLQSTVTYCLKIVFAIVEVGDLR
jgi:chorismate mutase